ncbi:MAG: Asp-tRNA(Asn)/Glu-tRNA(Gln) amidotransferase subunit GatC [Planctomycetota bacterium]
MQDLTHEDVRGIARLAKLRLTDEECADARVRLCAVLGHMEKLSELDLDGVEPMAHAHGEPCRLCEDVPGPTLDPELIHELAPRSLEVPDASGQEPLEDGMPAQHVYLAVPRVLPGGGGA